MNFLRKSKEIALVDRILSRKYCNVYHIPTRADEYNEKPEYPVILDPSPKATRRRSEESWYAKIQRQPTIEEKLFEINVPRYWGWNCLMLREGQIPYNTLSFSKYVTRTHLLDSKDVPEFYKEKLELASTVSKELKSAVEDEIAYQLSIRRRISGDISDLVREVNTTKFIVNAINRVLLRDVSSRMQHLTEIEVDYNPRIEAFWSIGGLDPPESVKKRRKAENKKISKEDLNETIDRWVQYIGSPILQVRHEKLLEPIWDEAVGGEVPSWTIEPKEIGYQNEYRHGTSIPGFWPGNERPSAILSYHSCNHLRYRPPTYGPEEKQEALQAQAMLSSFGWLVPLAAYRGFSPFSNVTYPMVNQCVLTDGKQITVSAYQLNTNALYGENATENEKTNICWCSQPENLYETVEDGKVMGLNEDVLSRLVMLYLNEPKSRPGVNLKPYLGPEVEKVADYEDEEKRIWLESEFKHFSANRPRHRVDRQYELYEWERIYKVEHQTRPMDPRRRPFELRRRPYQRKMSDHPGMYIPRGLRPDKDLPKWRQKKFKKTFYPQ